MTDFTGTPIDPTAAWEDIPELATTGRVLAGPGGPANAQAVALTARTKYLKDEIDTTKTVTELTIVAGVVTIDLSLSDYYTLEVDANVTSVVFTNPPGAGKGCSKFIEITQTGSFTFDFPAIFHWEGGSEGTISASAGMVDVLAITTLNNATSFHATLRMEVVWHYFKNRS